MVIDKKSILVLVVIAVVGLYSRLFHIGYGLPHSFQADEPEISEFAIKYTYELKDVLKNGNYYKLIPVSYVYGTAPTYYFTLVLIGFSKTLTSLNISFDKTTLFIFLRVINALTSVLIPLIGVLLYNRLFKSKADTTLTHLLLPAFLFSVSWIFVVHAHYLNVDSFETLLLLLANYVMVLYAESASGAEVGFTAAVGPTKPFSNKASRYLVLAGLFYGFAVGTKITALLTLPIYLGLILAKKDYRGLLAFLAISFGGFCLTNPFSIIFISDFLFRIYMFTVRENGLVFDSADFGWFKYLYALITLATPGVVIAAVVGGALAFGSKTKRALHVFFGSQVLWYLVFFTLSSRRVDRWLLPILPYVFVYAAFGLTTLKSYVPRPTFFLIVVVVAGLVLPKWGLLFFQYKAQTPKSQAYIWMRDTILAEKTKLVLTEEGLDPMNKLPFSHVVTFNVYESKSAQFELPPDPYLYDYVVLASKPMAYYKNPIVQKLFPVYFAKWRLFEQRVTDGADFRLVRSYVLPKPNLINVSDVFIYERVTKRLD